MRRVGSWGMTAALIVGLGGAVVCAGGPDNEVQAPPKGWFSGLFGDKPKPPAKVEKKPIELPADMPSTVESATAERQRQEHAILRRMEVCDRLRMVALQSGNEALMRQADELEMRAQEIYRQQTANLAVAPKPLASPAGTTDAKPARKGTKREATGGAKDTDAAQGRLLPQYRPSVYDTPDRLGGSFDQREQAAMGGSGMGRNKP